MRRYTLHYQIGTYSGTIEVTVDPDAEREHIIAKARRVLARRAGPLPFGAESWDIESWEDT